jgi:uncharacterized protein YuzB (UPF0349 family)
MTLNDNNVGMINYGLESYCGLGSTKCQNSNALIATAKGDPRPRMISNVREHLIKHGWHLAY